MRMMTTERSRWIVCASLEPGVFSTPADFRRSCSPRVRKDGAAGPGWARCGVAVMDGLFSGLGFVGGSESDSGDGAGPKSFEVFGGVGLVSVSGCLSESHWMVGDAGTMIRA